MRRLLFLSLLIFGCAKHVTVVPPSFDDALFAQEGVHCSDLTQDDPANVDLAYPKPDCQKIAEALMRGRANYATVYPEAANVKFSTFLFYRPKLYFVVEKPYPLISLSGDGQNLARGVTFLNQLSCSYEECFEHEIHHALGSALLNGVMRSPAAIDAPQDADQKALGNVLMFEIFCHGTSDDPFGQSGNRASCMQPYPLPAWSGYVAPAQ